MFLLFLHESKSINNRHRLLTFEGPLNMVSLIYEEVSLVDSFICSFILSLLFNHHLLHLLLLFLNFLDLIAKEVDVVAESLSKSLDRLVCLDLFHAFFEILSVLADGLLEITGLRLDNFGKECKATRPRLRILHAGAFIGLAAHNEEVVRVVLLLSTCRDDVAILAHT